MGWKNNTEVTEFILLGLTSNPRILIALFVIFLIVYLIILTGNSLIITVIITNRSLQTPMYFFLSNLSFLDIFYSTLTVPRMLRDMVSARKTISFPECAAQMYISLSLGVTECILLAVMAYDRYVAICYPLHYTTIINRSVCIRIATGTWICGFFLTISHVVLTLNSDFCASNEINHFACEVPEVLILGCGNKAIIQFVIFLVGVIVLMIPVTFIIVSYIKIIIAIFKISSSAGQQKAFSTCGSHLVVVVLFYGSAMSSYMKPMSSSSPDTDKKIGIFYGIITPMLNPLIYTLRNKDVKKALRKVPTKKIFIMESD